MRDNRSTAEAAPSKPEGPLLLLSLESSAYHAKLYSEESTFYLLTDSAAFRLIPGAPVETIPLPSGSEKTWAKGGVVMWVDGVVERADLGSGERRRVFALPEQPRALTAWRDEVGWLARTQQGTSLVHSDTRKEPAYRSRGNIETVTMLSDWLFFVERLPDATWRIGGVPTTGNGKPRFTQSRPGRPPAMLVQNDDALYYYDGNAFEVRRLTPDLQNESVVSRGGVCSPLAVSGHVFCARVEGIAEVAPGEQPRQLVLGGLNKLVTSLAATPSHVAWVSEAGTDRLEVHAVARGR